LNTDITATTKSDNNGVFSLEFQGPGEEKDFTILTKGEKSPFSYVNSSSSIKVIKCEKISVLIPDNVKVNQGDNTTISVSIINTGQKDYSNLALSLSGILDNYYTMPSDITELKANEEKKISIDFHIPENAGASSHTCQLKINYGNNSQEEQFILTISSKENIVENVSTSESFKFPSLPTGKFVLPESGLDILIVTLIAILIFSLSVLFKRKKFKKTVERKEVKNILLDVKGEIDRCSLKKEKIKKLKRKKSK
jgi:hypothetical protein